MRSLSVFLWFSIFFCFSANPVAEDVDAVFSRWVVFLNFKKKKIILFFTFFACDFIWPYLSHCELFFYAILNCFQFKFCRRKKIEIKSCMTSQPAKQPNSQPTIAVVCFVVVVVESLLSIHTHSRRIRQTMSTARSRSRRCSRQIGVVVSRVVGLK